VSFRHQWLGILASAAALGLSPTQVYAGTFSVSPLRLELSSRVQTGALTIRNQEETPVVVQAEGLLWGQLAGQDQLTPTRDVLVSPAVFTIPGNGSQLVRVALRRPADASRELSYRLILTEVPQQANPNFAGLNVALRLSMPIFVAPIATAEPRIEWSATHSADGEMALTARNAGNAHARVLNFNVSPATGSTPGIQQDVTAYILPGQSRTWTLDNKQNEATSSTDWQRLRVKGTTEAGDFEVEIRPEGP
jgi:fimbrial chaperone protein